jgi:hypothetical protein
MTRHPVYPPNYLMPIWSSHIHKGLQVKDLEMQQTRSYLISLATPTSARAAAAPSIFNRDIKYLLRRCKATDNSKQAIETLNPLDPNMLDYPQIQQCHTPAIVHWDNLVLHLDSQ